MTASPRSPIQSTEQPPYRPFDVEVSRMVRLSPSFVRITFTGADLRAFADNGNDQRLKLVLPLPGAGFRHFPRSGDWYTRWRLLPPELQNPIRTYTVRAARPHLAEVDVDLVLHGDAGPASRWGARAHVGAHAILIGPNLLHHGDTTAAEWRPPAGSPGLLIGADATAVPAACQIIAGLDDAAVGVVVLEIPTVDDRHPLRSPPGIRIDWRVQSGPPGAELEAGVRAAAAELIKPPAVPGADPGRLDHDLLWDVPTIGDRGVDLAPEASSPYIWLAGEASAAVRDLALDRRSVAFMGYWRRGQAESG